MRKEERGKRNEEGLDNAVLLQVFPSVHRSHIDEMSAPKRARSPAVAQGGFELLHQEMVRQARRQLPERESHARLEGMGHSVGYRLAERLSAERPRLGTALDVMKFMCKEWWTELFNRPIAKLQTNYKGVYVLHDGAFLRRWATPDRTPDELAAEARFHTAFASGMLAGALDNLGISCSVRCEVTQLPAVQFTVVDLKAVAAAPAAT